MRKIPMSLQPQTMSLEAIISPKLLFSGSIANEIRTLGVRFALFCDDTIDTLFGIQFCKHLLEAGLNVELFTFPSGEQEKSRERKALLEDLLSLHNFHRDSCIIALGGGVTTDLVGFLASTYLRGVPLVLIPTTLLAMVDAAIGGKTGVNTRFGKNRIGTFYPADRILIDPTALSSLPDSQLTNGAAEVIKYALIRSPELFELLHHWNPKDSAYMEQIIHACVQIKIQVVETDFEEKTGLRRILNFGHTIAHALELLENYTLPHGEAVAIGMLVESHLSVQMGHLNRAQFSNIDALIRTFGFPLTISKNITEKKMRNALLSDKKTISGGTRFVLLEKIGACHPFSGEYCTPVPDDILDEALSWMISQFSER